MKASVIVLSWNGMDYLEDCLNAVLSQDYPDFEVIVVDNGSTDGSADFVAQHFPRVRLICNERNLGFAAGNNVGLRAAVGDVLVLLNQDTVVRTGWLTALVKALKDKAVGVAGCKILYPDGKTIQHAGGWIEWPLGVPHHYGRGEQDTGQWDVPRPVEYVTGAAMAFRRDVLERVGFLDEEFWPGYFEDTDFCLRARKVGYEIWYTPDAVLTHVESASYTSQVSMWQAHHQGRMRFLLKHMTPSQFLREFVQAEELYQPTIISVFGSRPLCRAYLEAISRTPLILRNCWQAEQPTINEVIQALQHLHSLAWKRDWQRAKELIEAEIPIPALSIRLDYEMSLPETTAPSQLQGFELQPFELQDFELQEFELRELEFRSDVPVVGPLISWIRSFWYRIAAKWAIRYLMQQQEVINRYYAQRLKDYVRQQIALNQHYSQQQEALNQHYLQQYKALNQRYARQQEALNQCCVRRQKAISQRYQRYIEALEQRLAELADENALLAKEIANLHLRFHKSMADHINEKDIV